MVISFLNKQINTRNKRSLFVAIIQLLLYIVLCIVYPVISRKFGYMGFVNEFHVLRFFIVSIMVSFLVFIGMFIKRDFIYAIWNIYLAYTIFPTAIGYYSSLCGIQILFIHLIFMIVLLIFSQVTFPIIKFYQFNIEYSNNYYVLLFIAVILTLPFLYYLPYINPHNLLMQDLYATRYLFRKITIPWLDYIINPLVRVILPVLFITSVFKKKYLIALLSAGMVIYLFLCGAFRSYFVGLIAVVAFFIGNYRFKPVIFIGVLLFAAISGYLFSDFFYLLDAGIRRILFIPVHLEEVYFNTFSDNFLYWSHNRIGALFTNYPYNRDLSLYVGEVVMNRSEMNANVGMLIEGYFSAGYIGVVIHSLFLSFLFTFIDSLNISPRYFGIVIIIIFISVNSFLLTALISHGILAFLLLAFFFLKNTNCERKIYFYH